MLAFNEHGDEAIKIIKCLRSTILFNMQSINTVKYISYLITVSILILDVSLSIYANDRIGGKDMCIYGKAYSVDNGCNKCVCNANTGVPSCSTKKHCKKCVNKRDRRVCNDINIVCKLGHQYSPDNGCSTCFCTAVFSKSPRYFCTKEHCKQPIPKVLLNAKSH